MSPAKGGSAWVVAEGTANVTAPAAEPDDHIVEKLIEVFRAIHGEHPDWDEYRTAMIADRRVVIELHVRHLYGWLPQH